MIFNKTALALGVTSTLVLASCSGGEEAPVNAAPTIQSAFASSTALIANATDSNDDSLTYTWSVNGLTIGTGANLPLAAAPTTVTGIQTVTLTVSDGTLTDVMIVPSVDFGGDTDPGTGPVTNTPPVINSATISGSTLTAVAVDADAGTTLTYTWSVGSTTLGYGESLSIVGANVTGLQTVTLVVSDGTASVSKTVSNVDFGGLIVSPTETVPTITAAYLDGLGNLNAVANDEDGDALSYKWTVDGVTIGQTAISPISLAPSSITGLNNVVLEVTDGTSTVSETVVNVDFGGETNTGNQAPVIASAFVNAGSLTVSATDSDGDDLTYTWTVGSTVIGTGTILPVSSAPSDITGLNDVTVTVSDGTVSVEETVVNVDFGESENPTNNAPVITKAELSAANVLEAAATDSDGDTLSYVWSVGTASIGAGTSVALSDTTITGTYDVLLTVSDGTESVTRTVSNVDFGSTVTPGGDDLTGTNPPTVIEIDAVKDQLGPDAEVEGSVVYLPIGQGDSALDSARGVLVTDHGNFTLPYVPSIDYGTSNAFILDNFNDGNHQNNLGAAVATLYGENYTEGGGYWYSFTDGDSTVTNNSGLNISPYNIFGAVEASPGGSKEFCINIDVVADGYAGVGANLLYEASVVDLTGLQSVEVGITVTRGAPVPMFEPDRESLGGAIVDDWGNYAADPITDSGVFTIPVADFVGEEYSELGDANHTFTGDGYKATKFFFQVKDTESTSFCLDYIKFNGIGITAEQFPWKHPADHSEFAKTIDEIAEEVARPNVYDPANPYLDWDTVTEIADPATPIDEPTKASIDHASANWITRTGTRLYDDQGDQVRLTGVNWFGIETKALIPMGLWTRSYKSMLDQMVDLGFNTVRIPFSDYVITESRAGRITLGDAGDNFGNIALDIDLDIPDHSVFSADSTPLDVLDKIVAHAQSIGLKIILDSHSRGPDQYLAEGFWENEDVFGVHYTAATWIENWEFLAQRYKNMDSVVAMDLNNEPHFEAAWGSVDSTYNWDEVAEDASEAILAVNPNVLILIEGVESLDGYESTATSLTKYWWGGNLQGVERAGIDIGTYSNNTHPKLVFSPHEYGPEVYLQPWFTDSRFPNNMKYLWEDRFGFVNTDGIGHMLIGEFGIRDNVPGSVMEAWFDEWLEYMGDRKDGYSWTFWAWNPNSGDTGGILKNDWSASDVNDWKVNALKPYMAPMIGNGPATEANINN